MTIWELTEDAIATLGVPYAANVYIPETGETFPDLYLVYFLVSGVPEGHADDAEILRTRRVQVTIYSRDGLADLPDVSGAMVDAGFTRSSERELPYDRETRFYGLALDFFHLAEQGVFEDDESI